MTIVNSINSSNVHLINHLIEISIGIQRHTLLERHVICIRNRNIIARNGDKLSKICQNVECPPPVRNSRINNAAWHWRDLPDYLIAAWIDPVSVPLGPKFAMSVPNCDNNKELQRALP